ncbi:hypothetical protein FRC04_001750 [Tulasnella sp. 424]|nr:hypothetical protein FRC04_001750 [Tulasnella sp. 424]
MNVEREQMQSTNIDTHNLNFDRHHPPSNSSPILRPLKRKPSSCLCQSHDRQDSTASSVGDGDECVRMDIAVATSGISVVAAPAAETTSSDQTLVVGSNSVQQHLQIILERHPSPDTDDESSQRLGSPAPSSSSSRAGTDTTATHSPAAEDPMEVEEAEDDSLLLSSSPSQDPDRRSQSPVHSSQVIPHRVLPHVYHEPWVSPSHGSTDAPSRLQ